MVAPLRRLLLCVLLVLPAAVLLAGVRADVALGQACSRDQFGKVMNDSGAALRRLSAESQPKMQTGIRRLREKNSWREDEYVDKANALLADERSESFDQKASDLLARLDRLAEEVPNAPDNCARLAELEATALELQATVRAKTEYMLAKLDALVADKDKAAAEKPVARADPKSAAQPPAAAKQPPAREQQTAVRAPEKKAWDTQTSQTPTAAENAVPMQPVPDAYRPPQPPPLPRDEDGYTIDEIKAASRGFFGTISAGLGSVIEYAFAKSGRPTAYVLGTEGGGALLAGVRYGKGTLYVRNGGTERVYWHGPSIGYDVGASGSKTMFLIYGLHDPGKLYSGFTGIDGSAYVVGGVGITFLTDGKVIMAPIRSGIGLRIGASVGYVRFTPHATWNPF